ncbi:MAG: toll/interleukin-1 receptor domain-containing protein [Lachnospiraceae bacterium]|nr:toll/interleukin-1 receptor domain-containing protein [Lachnospiraceae bacterium]
MEQSKKYDVFISYSSKDSKEALELLDVFSQHGLSCWIAEKNIEHGVKWAAAIDEAIQQSRVLAVLISEHSIRSVQVPKELGLAVNSCQMIVPIRLDQCELTGEFRYYLSDCQWSDITRDRKKRLAEVAVAIQKSLGKTETAESETVVQEDIPVSKPVKVQKKKTEPKKTAQPRRFPKVLVGIVAAVIVLPLLLTMFFSAGIQSSMGGSEKNAEAMDVTKWPQSIANYEFILNDIHYQLPFSWSQMQADGYELKDPEDGAVSLVPGEERSVQVINQYGSFEITLFNPTNDTIKGADAYVGSVYFKYYELNNSELEKEYNTVASAEGIVLGADAKDLIKEQYKEKGLQNSSSGYIFKNGQGSEYCFLMDTKGQKLIAIRIKNQDSDLLRTELSQRAVLTEKPEYYTEEFYTKIGMDDFSYVIEGHEIKAGMLISDYLELGWTLEEAPELIASKGTGEVRLNRDVRTTVTLEVYNPADQAVVPEFGLVTTIDEMGIGENADLNKVAIRGLGMELNHGMEEADVIQMLEDQHMDYRYPNENYIEIYPYGEDVPKIIKLYLGSSKKALNLQLDVSALVTE